MKKLKKFIATILVASMIFSSHATLTFAEGLDDVAISEESVEEVSVENAVTDATEDLIGVENNSESLIDEEEVTTIANLTTTNEDDDLEDDEESSDHFVEEPEEDELTNEEIEVEELDIEAEYNSETESEETTISEAEVSEIESSEIEVNEIEVYETENETSESNEEETTEEETTMEETTTIETVTEESANVESEENLFGDGTTHTFTFRMPENSGKFNAPDGPEEIVFSSDTILTDPVEIPVVYMYQSYFIVDSGWRRDSSDGEFLSDSELETLVADWNNNPSEDKVIYASFFEITDSDLISSPTKTNYYAGEEVDTSGFSIKLTGDDDMEKVASADMPQYKRFINIILLDEEELEIAWDNIITADTKYIQLQMCGETYSFEVNVAPSPTYRVHYDENVPEGFELERGWIDDATTTDIEAGITIESNSIGRLLCTNGSHKKLVRWNTSADGTGTNYDLGAVINDPSVFTDYVLTLYAVWDKTYLSNPAFVVNYCEGDLNTKKYAMITDLAEYSSFENYIWNPINDNIPEGKTIIGYYSIPVQYVSRDEDEDMQDYYVRARNTIAENYNPENPDYIETNIEQEWEVNWKGVNANYDVIWGVVYGEKQYNIKYVDKYFGTDLTPYFENYDSALVHRGTDGHFPAFSNYDSKRIVEGFEVKRYLYINSDNQLVEAEDGSEITDEETTIYVEGNKGVLPPIFKILRTVEIVTDSLKVNYIVGETLDVLGLVLKLSFADDSVRYVEYSKELSEFIKFSVDVTKRLTGAVNSVAVTIGGIEARYKINVTTPYIPSNSGSRGGSSSSDPTRGPMGDLTKNPAYSYLLNNMTNTYNNLSVTNLVPNQSLATSLLSDPENANRANTNVTDINGNSGFGKWQKVPGTSTWYFLSGDVNGTSGNYGFITNGWYNLGWNGNTGWYHFDGAGIMQVGWYEENGKRYYFNSNPMDADFGKSVVGAQNIDGVYYNFDSTGALIQ